MLVEKDRDTDAQTTFVVEPQGSGASVTITTELTARDGLGGAIERFLSTRYLLGVYRTELEKLNAVARL